MENMLTSKQLVHLRPYRPDDLEPIIQLWYHTWHHTYPDLRHPQTIEQWRTRFQQEIIPNESIWVAERNHQLVGFLAIRKSDGYLHLLYVSPEEQRQRVGTNLMNKAKELSPGGISLKALQRNMQARRFYEQHGFQPMYMRTNAINGEPKIAYHWDPRSDEQKD
jgi:putative acetyltransferase